MSENSSKLTKSNAYLEANSQDDNENSIEMFNINFKKTVEPILVNLKINNILVSMELDSGAGISILPENLFLSKLKSCSIKPTKVKLKMYNGSIIEPVGEMYVKVEINNVEHKVKLIIVKSNNRPLLGRDLMKLFKMEVTNINQVENINGISGTTSVRLNELIKKNKELFLNKNGLYIYMTK